MFYHVTWKSRVASIREHGLLPNYIPNDWKSPAIHRHCRGKVFLTRQNHVETWLQEFRYDMALPEPDDELMVLEVSVDEVGLERGETCDEMTTRYVHPNNLGRALTVREYLDSVYRRHLPNEAA